ncbi:hypothetical protein [Delftia lacustris]|uniref:hypothetical protein n=1 Tax=Delftia lacustris TaxID=558537 RepID=UPI001FCE1C47|nr:hypothetical protein [Delftia lacustris]BDE75225.1 hypothetical protein HQS1_63490 [Delftia lacustris]
MIDPLDQETFELTLSPRAMTTAERQRRHRQKRKEQRENEGLRAINLTRTDRMVLSLGLLAHEDLNHRGPNWLTDQKPGFDALLHKLWPEGDNGLYLDEPKRSSYRPAARLRDNLQRTQEQLQRTQQAWHADLDKLRGAEEESRQLKATLAEIIAELRGESVAPATPAVDVAAMQAELARLRAECELLETERSKAFAAVKVFEDRLRVHGLSIDYRAQLGS